MARPDFQPSRLSVRLFTCLLLSTHLTGPACMAKENTLALINACCLLLYDRLIERLPDMNVLIHYLMPAAHMKPFICTRNGPTFSRDGSRCVLVTRPYVASY